MLTAERLRDALARLPPSSETVLPTGQAAGGAGGNLPSARSGDTKLSGKIVDAPDVSWTEYYPFPVFAKREADEPNMDADSDSDDDGYRPPGILKPHPLSADEVLNAHNAKPNNTSNGSPGEGSLAVSSVHRLRQTPSRIHSAVQSSRHSATSKPTVTKEEITALVSVFDPTNPLGSRVDLAHMDLQWIVRKKRSTKGVTPPAVHLHLGNVSASLNTASKDQQVLINSPRSAIVLIRNGVTIHDLKKQPGSLSTSVVEKKPFVTLEQLTWEQKKYLALETARLAKLREVVEEYKEVCASVSFDDITTFCSAYRPDRPSTAMLIPFAGAIDKGRARRSPEVQCEERLDSLVQKFERREQRINRSTTLLNETLEEERQRIVDRLVRAEERAQSAVEARLEHVRSMGIASRGRSELWRAQRQRHDRVETFERMVTREGLQRRLDEVAQVQLGMKNTIASFQDRVRRQNLSESMQRQTNHASFIKRAKQMFLETQK